MKHPFARTRWPITVLACTVLVLSACSGDAASDPPEQVDATSSADPADDDYVIGVWGPTDWVQGEGIVQGASLAATEINEQGGIGGRNIEIRSDDSEGNPEGAATVVRRLLGQDVDALIGGFLTGEVLAVVDIIADAKVPYLNPGASSMSIQAHLEEDYDRYRYLFRIGVNVQHLAEEACRYLTDVGLEYGATHVGVIYDDRQWTEELRPFLLECIDEMGLTVSLSGYDHTATDYSANFFELQNQGADWLVALSAAAEGIILAQQWGELRVAAPLTGFIAEAQEEGFLAATNQAGAYAGPFWQAAVPGLDITSRTQQFLESYEAEYGESPIYNAFGAYEAVYALAEAVEAAGTADPDHVVDALASVEFEGVYGTIRFNETHERHFAGADQPLGVQIMPDGERRVLTAPAGVPTEAFTPPPWLD